MRLSPGFAKGLLVAVGADMIWWLGVINLNLCTLTLAIREGGSGGH